MGGGLLGGGGGTLVAPGVGTIGSAISGAELGGAIGAAGGSAAGNAAGQTYCPNEDDDDECEELLRKDTDTCNGITRMRGARAGAICHASASQRYAECRRGGIGNVRTRLSTWNN